MPALKPEHCERLFPFFIETNAELRIVGVGRALRRLIPADAIGRPFVEIFAVERPVLAVISLEALLARQSLLYLLRLRGRELRLRGEFMGLDAGVLFVGIPWLTQLAQLQRSELTLQDFALHDPTGDLLVVLRTMEMSLGDARRLAEQLRRQAQLLVEARDAALMANDALEARVSERTADLAAKNATLAEALATLQRTQEQLIQAEKMASLGLLVAGIAHELKNPLNFVNNFAALSLEFVDEIEELAPAFASRPPGEALRELLRELAANLRRIRDHGQRADATINTMLMHARDRRGEPIELDVNAMLVEYTNLAYHGFRAADRTFAAEVIARLDPTLGPVTGPFQDLARVVVNLVSNACHAMRERQRCGEPGYRAVLTIGSRIHDDRFELTIADNGTGISAEAARRLFDPFFTTKPPGEGTGLGLSLCYEIVVKELGGSIDVTSAPDEGAAFFVRVPLGVRPESRG